MPSPPAAEHDLDPHGPAANGRTDDPFALPSDPRWAEAREALLAATAHHPLDRAAACEPDPTVVHLVLADTPQTACVRPIAAAYAAARVHRPPRDWAPPDLPAADTPDPTFVVWACAADLPLETLFAIEATLSAGRVEPPVVAYMTGDDPAHLRWLAAKTLRWLACRPAWPDLYYDGQHDRPGLSAWGPGTIAVAGVPERLAEPADLLAIFTHGRSFESALLRSTGRNVTLCTQPAAGSNLRCGAPGSDAPCFRGEMLDGHERLTPAGLRARVVATTSCSAFRLGASDIAPGSGVALRLLDGWATGVIASRHEDLLREPDWLLVVAGWKAGLDLGQIVRALRRHGIPDFSPIGDPTQRRLAGRDPGYARAEPAPGGGLVLSGPTRSVVSVPLAAFAGRERPGLLRSPDGATEAVALGQLSIGGEEEVVYEVVTTGGGASPPADPLRLDAPRLATRPASLRRRLLEALAAAGSDLALDTSTIDPARLDRPTAPSAHPVGAPGEVLAALAVAEGWTLRDPQRLLAAFPTGGDPDAPALTVTRHAQLLLQQFLEIAPPPDWRDPRAAVEAIAGEVIRSYARQPWPAPLRDGVVRYLDVRSEEAGTCFGCGLPTLLRWAEVAPREAPDAALRRETFCARCGQVGHAPDGGDVSFALPGVLRAGDAATLRDLRLPDAEEGVVWACVFPLEHPRTAYAPDDPARHAWHAPTSRPLDALPLGAERFLPGLNYVRLYWCGGATATLAVGSRLIRVVEA